MAAFSHRAACRAMYLVSGLRNVLKWDSRNFRVMSEQCLSAQDYCTILSDHADSFMRLACCRKLDLKVWATRGKEDSPLERIALSPQGQGAPQLVIASTAAALVRQKAVEPQHCLRQKLCLDCTPQRDQQLEQSSCCPNRLFLLLPASRAKLPQTLTWKCSNWLERAQK